MKVLVLTALFAAVVSGLLENQAVSQAQEQWPWQAGKLYRYEVESYTLARLHEGPSSGNAFRAYFAIQAKAPGLLLARLERPEHAKVHEKLNDKDQRTLTEHLKYEAVKNLEQPFEITLKGGRVVSLRVPTTLSVAHENLLKGLIGTLQVDLSTHRTEYAQNSFNHETHQGQFKKMETDVTGDCSTLYTVLPADVSSSEWRYVLKEFEPKDKLMVITKSKDYGHCHHRVGFHFGVPETAEWTGAATKAEQEQFIDRATNYRILAEKNGHIYKAETTNTINVHPHMYGKQKAEVISYVSLQLKSIESENLPEWQMPESSRLIQSLLYSMSTKQIAKRDDYNESESNEEAYVQTERLERERRSIRTPKKIVAINKIIINKRADNEDEDNSSSDESTSAYVNDETPQNNEPAYAALYMNPQDRKPKKMNPANAQKLVQEMAQLLHNINNMPKSDFLSKFNILVRVIASMDYEQLAQTSRAIEQSRVSTNAVKSDMWMIFRDAVAQAGTQPAFKQITEWIQKKTIQGEEAAQVVATLPKTLRYPTKNAMIQFFNLAMSSEVAQQEYLHSTAVIAAARFINMGQVDNETAHSYYPTHMYGRLSPQHDNFVLEDILPRLSQKLEQAIQQQDSRKAQVYVKAIGQLGHRSILDVFAPYLEGKIPVSTYLRAMMIRNLVVLAHEKDSYTRAYLYNILRNTAEPYEVRVSAVHRIFIAHPTAAMMQAMAQMTHDDPSMQVRAVLKSSIETAAQQRNPRHMELARIAQAASHMLTKEKFGEQYSSNKYLEYFDSDSELGIFGAISTMGSEDSILPKYWHYSHKSQTNGMNIVSASASSVQRILEKLEEQIRSAKPETQCKQEGNPNFKFSASDISKKFDIKRDSQEPLKASFNVDIMNQHRYFSFNEEDFDQLHEVVNKFFHNLGKGMDVHYTKVVNQAQVSVLFPVAMGMPFIYKYKEPTIVHIMAKGNSELRLNENAAGIQGELQITYARNIDGSVGFLDTLSDQLASAGIVNKVQMNIPLKINLQWQSREVKVQLEHIRPEQDTTIVHYSVWPYTSNQKKDSLTTISLDPETKLVQREKKTALVDYRIGQSVGTQYQLQGYSMSSDYNNMGRLFQSRNMLANLIQAIYQKDVALTHFNWRYLGSKSQNKRVTFQGAFDAHYNLKDNDNVPLEASKLQDVKPNSAERRDELVKRVASTIKGAKAYVADWSISFDGAQKNELVLTTAMADSPIDPKIQYAFFASRNTAQGSSQINGVGQVNKPEVSFMDLRRALEKDLKMTFAADIKYGENDGNVHIEGNAERSNEYREQLKKHPSTKRSYDQINAHNYYQKESHKMLVLSHAPDVIKASVTYKDVSPAVKYVLFQAYRIAERYGQWDADMNPLKALPEGKLEMEVQNYYFEHLMNMNLNSRYGEIKLKDVAIPRSMPSFISAYTPVKPYERLGNYYMQHMFQPYCSVDGTQIRTFSNRQYNYTLSDSWHVVMQDGYPTTSRCQDQLVILANRPASHQEVYISYRSEANEYLEIEIKPSQGSFDVKVNTETKKVSDGKLTTYLNSWETPFLQYYVNDDGVLMLNIRENRLRLMYDGERLVAWTRDGMNAVWGLCGRMNGEPRDDFQTPAGWVDDEKHFGESYALDDAQKYRNVPKEAWRRAFQEKYQYTAMLKPDNEWHQWLNEESLYKQNDKVFRSKSYLKQARGNCVISKQVQYYQTQTEICITMAPLDVCSSHCKGQDYEQQEAQVVCRPKDDQQFQEYVMRIRQGQNPEVSGRPFTVQYKVPQTCTA